ncbi:DNA cytosine methyltransferase [Porphyromonas gulae]|uniref:DNA cytosine methyltransferase n=1 Tax=Porphyromonas gulae TaxID=111105 RepID=UPI00068F6F22|nr:DNA cytosine methyltransferase [Porphyromonas gulae]
MHKNKRKELLHIGLFEGIGGFGLAAKWNGIETIATCEINEFGNKVTAHHFPDSYKHGDIRTLTRKSLDERLISKCGRDWADRTILTAGFPCQPFSVAGRRAGADDDRYLWPETLRVIAEVRPAWVIGENVAGILSMVQPVSVVEMASGTDAFGEVYDTYTERSEFIAERICQDFEGIGYSVLPFVIPACAVGAPHRRDRIWFVAHSESKRRIARGGR